LAAGRRLAVEGKRVAMVEARDRIGGRIFTSPQTLRLGAVPSPIELGAEFVHGLPRSTWDLIREARLATFELDGAQWCFDEGLHPCGEEHRGAFKVLAQMPQWLAAQPKDSDASFAEYLARAGIEKSLADRAAAYVEGFNAADRNIIGVAALVRQQSAEDEIQATRIFRIRAGYTALPGFLADQFRQAGGTINFGTPVRTIRWNRGEVRVSGVDAGNRAFELHGSQALITLPLGVLQAGAVRFDPEPGDIGHHAARMAMGPVVRQTLLFERPFWEDAGGAADLSFLFAGREKLPTWWTIHPDTTPMITAWAAGPKAIALSPKAALPAGPLALRDEALNALARMFGFSGVAVTKMLVGWHFHDWQSDEFSRGAYSYAPAGALDASLKMTQPVQRTLYFAGEHTDIDGHWGTVHAAFNSGLRAADQILNDAGIFRLHASQASDL